MTTTPPEPGRIRRVANGVSRWRQDRSEARQDRRETKLGTNTLKGAFALGENEAKRTNPRVRERIGRAKLTKADLQQLAMVNVAAEFNPERFGDLARQLNQEIAKRIEEAGPDTGPTLNPVRAFRRWRNVRIGTNVLKGGYARAGRDVKNMDRSVRQGAGRRQMNKADLLSLAQGRIEQVIYPDGPRGPVPGMQDPQQAGQPGQAAGQPGQAAGQQEPLVNHLQAAMLQMQTDMQTQLQQQARMIAIMEAQQALMAQQLAAQQAAPAQATPQPQAQNTGPTQDPAAQPPTPAPGPAPAPAAQTPAPAPAAQTPAPAAQTPAPAAQTPAPGPAAQQGSDYGKADFDAYVTARLAQLQSEVDAQYAQAPGPQPQVEFFSGERLDAAVTAQYAAMQAQAKLNYEQAQAQQSQTQDPQHVGQPQVPQPPAAAPPAPAPAPAAAQNADPAQPAVPVADHNSGPPVQMQPLVAGPEEPTAEGESQTNTTETWMRIARGESAAELGQPEETAAAQDPASIPYGQAPGSGQFRPAPAAGPAEQTPAAASPGQTAARTAEPAAAQPQRPLPIPANVTISKSEADSKAESATAISKALDNLPPAARNTSGGKVSPAERPPTTAHRATGPAAKRPQNTKGGD